MYSRFTNEEGELEEENFLKISYRGKVIIGYSYSDERGEMEKRKLSFISKWMQKVEALQKGIDEEYLIILGNGCNHATGEADYTSFDYKGYLYNWDKKEFEIIIAD